MPVKEKPMVMPMGSIKPLFFLAITLCAFSVFAQNAPRLSGVSLEAEIQNMERAAGRQGVSAQERHDALVSLARLRQLSGDIEGAARNWLEAAAAIPGQVDDDALLSCAYCLAAMGEWDRARAALEPLLAKSARARLLNISINAVSTGNNSTLAAIVDNPEYAQMKSEIYFLLWKTSPSNLTDGNRAEQAERWRQRLIAEFPQSPEGRLAAMGDATGEASTTIAINPSPFWLLMGGLDSLPVMESQSASTRTPSAAPSAPSSTTPSATSPSASVSQTNTPPASAPSGGSVSASNSTPASVEAKLQTGVFSREANAQAQAASLRQSGFSPSIERRVVNNNEMWAVTVPAGADANRTIAILREAGFESFPLR